MVERRKRKAKEAKEEEDKCEWEPCTVHKASTSGTEKEEEEDGEGEAEESHHFWIQCDLCQRWFHGPCVGVEEYESVILRDYHCPPCQEAFGPSKYKEPACWGRFNLDDANEEGRPPQVGTRDWIRDFLPKQERLPPPGEWVETLGEEETLKEVVERSDWARPILIPHRAQSSIRLPDSDFGIRDVLRILGPERRMEVIDVYAQHSYGMSLGRFAGMWEEREKARGRLYNVISLEFSKSRLVEEIQPPEEVKELSWVERWWGPDAAKEAHPHMELHAEHAKLKPEVLYFCLMGMGGSYTDFHVDFGGSSVWYNVLWGRKVFYIAPPTEANREAFVGWHTAPDRSSRFLADEMEVRRVELLPGQTLMIPSGWVHAVYTPVDTLVFGGNILHSLHIPMQLAVGEMEERMGVTERYRFPSFDLCAWYALQEVAHSLKDASEAGRAAAGRTMDAARALHSTLAHWLKRDKKKYTSASKSGGLAYTKHLRELGRALADQEALAKAPAKAAPKTGSGRPRGRPPKTASPAATETAGARSRGRPPKTASPVPTIKLPSKRTLKRPGSKSPAAKITAKVAPVPLRVKLVSKSPTTALPTASQAPAAKKPRLKFGQKHRSPVKAPPVVPPLKLNSLKKAKAASPRRLPLKKSLKLKLSLSAAKASSSSSPQTSEVDSPQKELPDEAPQSSVEELKPELHSPKAEGPAPTAVVTKEEPPTTSKEAASQPPPPTTATESDEEEEEKEHVIGFSLMDLQRGGSSDSLPRRSSDSPPKATKPPQSLSVDVSTPASAESASPTAPRLIVSPIKIGKEERRGVDLGGGATLDLDAMFKRESASGRKPKPSAWVTEALQEEREERKRNRGPAFVYTARVEEPKVSPKTSPLAPPPPAKAPKAAKDGPSTAPLSPGAPPASLSLLSLAVSAKSSTPANKTSMGATTSNPSNGRPSLAGPASLKPAAKQRKAQSTVKQRLASKLRLTKFR